MPQFKTPSPTSSSSTYGDDFVESRPAVNEDVHLLNGHQIPKHLMAPILCSIKASRPPSLEETIVPGNIRRWSGKAQDFKEQLDEFLPKVGNDVLADLKHNITWLLSSELLQEPCFDARPLGLTDLDATLIWNSEQVGLSLKDSRGTLDTKLLIDLLHSDTIVRGRPDLHEHNSTFLGSKTFFSRLSHANVYVHARHSTEMTMVRRLDESPQEFRQSKPLICVYLEANGESRMTTRFFDRRPLQQKVQLQLAGQWHESTLRDISSGGVFLEFSPKLKTLDLDAHITLRIPSSHSELPVFKKGIVRWIGQSDVHNRYGAGLEMTQLSAFLPRQLQQS